MFTVVNVTPASASRLASSTLWPQSLRPYRSRFASLSLDPPLISFAPARTSSTWPQIRDIGTFCVNVLAADHRELSVGFARSGQTVDKFAGVDWCPAPSGAPVLEGVSAWIDCTLWAEHDGGDHTIVVGRVLDLGADPSRLPLLFYRGGYGVDHR